MRLTYAGKGVWYAWRHVGNQVYCRAGAVCRLHGYWLAEDASGAFTEHSDARSAFASLA